MRFERVVFQAFGHFSGAALDFSAGPTGVHLIYGPNEAGKSTALRGITALLYGVPEQSTDTFLHEGKQIRLLGEIAAGGERLAFTRRKGRTKTLLDAAGNPLDELVLAPFLGGVDEKLWRNLFGLDHETLRHGAEALLAGEGALGESLFDAGRGTGSIRQVLIRLRAECEPLYTRLGRNRRINQQLSQLVAARQLVTERTTLAASYQQQQQRVEELCTTLAELKSRRTELLADKGRCERLLRILPLVAQRQALLVEREALGPVPNLPADAEQRRGEWQRALEECELNIEHERLEMKRVNDRLAQLIVPEALVAIEGARVEEVSQRLGSVRKAQLDLPKRQGELRAIAEETTALLRRLGRETPLAELERLAMARPDENRARRLARTKTQADTRREECLVKIKRCSDVVNKRQKELGTLPVPVEVTPLERAIVRAQRHVEQELQLAAAKQRVAEWRERAERQAELVRGLGVATPPGAARVLPDDAALAEWAQRSAKLQQALETKSSAAALLRGKLEQLEARRGAITVGGEVPSETRLVELRKERDATLRAGQRTLEESGVLAPSWWASLVHAIREADDYAARLQRETSRVTAHAAVVADLAETGALLRAAETELSASERANVDFQERFREFWQPFGVVVGDRGVSDVRVWAAAQRELLAAELQLDREHQSVTRLEASLADVIAELSRELEKHAEPARLLWETLPQFVERAQSLLERLRRQNTARLEAEQRLALERARLSELQLELAELKEEEKQWRGEWQAVLRDLGLGKEATSESVTETLDDIADLLRKAEEMRNLERRIAGIVRDADDFEASVEQLVQATLPELAGRPLDAKVAEWVASYRRATSDAREQERLRQELQQRSAHLARTELDARRYRGNLEQLMSRSGVTSVDELVALEGKVRKHEQLTAAILEEERKILAHGEGGALEDQIAAVRGQSGDELRRRILQSEAELTERDQLLDTTLRELAAAEQQLDRARDGAAEAAEELAARGAELQQSIDHYVRLRLGIHVLEAEIERYRREHQGPVLGQASRYFAALTAGRYRGLEVGFDGKDEQVLQCVPQTGKQVPVFGLSDGTRDQLYLSLRLASIEQFMQRGTVMPLVFDDILVHFDDARAAAALEVLGEFASRTQVLFFTHHPRVRDLALERIPADRLWIHGLGQPG